MAEKVWKATLGRADMMKCFEHAADAAQDLAESQFQDFKKVIIEFVSTLTAEAIEIERSKLQPQFGKVISYL